MSYVLKLQNVIVGRCDLPTGEELHSSRQAPFRPGLGWDLVEPIFQLSRADDDEQRARYAKSRDALSLALYDSAGSLLETTRIDIVDDPASPTGLTITAHLVYRG